MAVSPDDRFAGLINSSAERGGWVPGDVFGSDSEGEDEPVEPRRVRPPILVALAVATIAVLVISFLIFRPAPHHAASEEQVGSAEGNGADSGDSADTGSGASSGGGTVSRGSASPTAPKSPETGTVVVHVTGAVHRPSVVSLSAGARVQDAVEEAGGLKEQADAEAINLARVLQDGEQIHIPARGEEPEAERADSGGGASNADGSPGGSSGAGGGAGGSAASGAAEGNAADTPGSAAADPDPGPKVDLNTADLTTLQTLPGVGPVTAEAIIAHREEQPFASVEDLLLVQGIGPKTFESLQDLVAVG